MNLIEKTPSLVFWMVQFAALLVLWGFVGEGESAILAGSAMAALGIALFCIGAKS